MIDPLLVITSQTAWALLRTSAVNCYPRSDYYDRLLAEQEAAMKAAGVELPKNDWEALVNP